MKAGISLTILPIGLRHSQSRMQRLRNTGTSPSRKNNYRGRAALDNGMSTPSTSHLLYTCCMRFGMSA